MDRRKEHVGLGATKCYASDPRQNTNMGVYEQTNAAPVTQDRTQTGVYEQTNAAPVTQDRTQTEGFTSKQMPRLGCYPDMDRQNRSKHQYQ